MIFQHFDFLLCLHHHLTPEGDLSALSWFLIDTHTCACLESLYSELLPVALKFQPHSLEHILVCLHRSITNIEQELRSVVIVTFNRELMEIVLPREAQRRNIALPSAFCNFVSLTDDPVRKGFQSMEELAFSVGGMNMMDPAGVILGNICISLIRQGSPFNRVIYIDRVRNKTLELGGSEDVIYYRLRGLPFKVLNHEIVGFLGLMSLDEENIEYEYTYHKFSGNAWIMVPSEYAELIESKHQQHLGNRYIEITKVSKNDFLRVRNNNHELRNEDFNRKSRSRSRSQNRYRNRRSRSRDRRRRSQSHESEDKYPLEELNNMGILKMRGLPFSATTEDILGFFEGHLPIPHSLKLGYQGSKKSGDGVILFATRKEAKDALSLDRMKMGNRYIELITIPSEEYRRFR